MSLKNRAAQGVPSHLLIHIAGLPHCPRNRSHAILRKGKTSFLGKTEAARSYEAALLHHLAKYKAWAEIFMKEFDPKTDHLVANWEFTSPDLYTKDRRISQNSTDLDAHKVLQDTIMGFIGIDDAFIVKDTRTKLEGDFHVSLELVIRDNNGAYLL